MPKSELPTTNALLCDLCVLCGKKIEIGSAAF
jgi:hypothetical protein